jgi:hypothetical protein
MLEIQNNPPVQPKKETRRRYPVRDHIRNVNANDRYAVQVNGSLAIEQQIPLHSVIIDNGIANQESSQDLHFSYTLKDRVKVGLHRAKVNICDGITAGAIIGLGVAVGTGVATGWTLALPAPELESIKGLLIGIGVAGGAVGAIGVGFADGIRVDTRALSVAGIAAIATGAFIELQAIGTPTEGPRDIVALAVRSIIAATAAAFAGGIITSVASGIHVRRNWVY